MKGIKTCDMAQCTYSRMKPSYRRSSLGRAMGESRIPYPISSSTASFATTTSTVSSATIVASTVCTSSHVMYPVVQYFPCSRYKHKIYTSPGIASKFHPSLSCKQCTGIYCNGNNFSGNITCTQTNKYHVTSSLKKNIQKREFHQSEFVTQASSPENESSRSNSNHLNEIHFSGIDSIHKSSSDTFSLTENFLQQYKKKKPPFGFNGLGEIVYRRTYSRIDSVTGQNEEWWQTVARVVNGTYNMQKKWIQDHGLGWNPWKAQKSAQEMYRRIFEMKFLPPGRGLWAMGSPITEEKNLYAALNNCAFISTDVMKTSPNEPSKPFYFLMDLSMLGVGVGFDTKGAGYLIKGAKQSHPAQSKYVIDDSREGWVESVRILLDSHFLGKELPQFDYSKIRPKGAPIKGFGGVSSGPETIKALHQELNTIIEPLSNTQLTTRTIVDIMNLIGKCIVSGNVRQSAEIAFGEYNDTEFIDLKNYTLNPERASYGWTSNNSIFAKIGMNYKDVANRITKNGEPGIAYLHNMKAYSRMNGAEDWKDRRASGGNPCLEQTLESFELCCLVETFPDNHEDLDDFLKTLKMAYLYAKTVTLGKTHWAESNRVMLRNRRIGCSMSGIAQFITNRGIEELRRWCNTGYHAIQEHDRKFSDWLAIPRSIKTTSIKPSGTVSLLAGCTPGLHYPESKHYIRRLRMGKTSNLLPPLQQAGYKIEASFDDPENTVVVEFPVKVSDNIRIAKELSMWEQLSLAAFMQKNWSDNQVSCTVTFDPETEGPQIAHALDYFQYQLKGVSFLPRLPEGAYKQMPYEHITEEEYNRMTAHLKPLDFSSTTGAEPTPDKFCDAFGCIIEQV